MKGKIFLFLATFCTISSLNNEVFAQKQHRKLSFESSLSLPVMGSVTNEAKLGLIHNLRYKSNENGGISLQFYHAFNQFAFSEEDEPSERSYFIGIQFESRSFYLLKNLTSNFNQGFYFGKTYTETFLLAFGLTIDYQLNNGWYSGLNATLYGDPIDNDIPFLMAGPKVGFKF